MHSGSRSCSVLIVFATGLVLASCPLSSSAQQDGSGSGTTMPAVVTPAALFDAPSPQVELAAARLEGNPQSGQAQNTQQPPPNSDPAPSTSNPAVKNAATPSTSSAQTQQPDDQKTQHQEAEEQLKQQEHQRVAGIMATFNTTRNPNAVPLSPGQKFHLFFKSAFDPWPFALSSIVAAIDQADDSPQEWGQGMQGYAKRFGGNYSDYFIGNFFGNAVFPSLIHEDPRYFQKGSGSFTSRFLWAAASTVWCKRDKGGWGPNWANVGGNLVGAAIARTYYPASQRTVGDTFSDGLTVSAEGIVGAEVIEFWPDMVRYHRRKQAEKQARAMDAAKEQKKKENQENPNQHSNQNQ